MKTKVNEPEWLSFSQAARLKDVSKQTVYQWKDSGKLTVKTGANGRLLIENNNEFKKLKATGNVRKDDLVMEYIRELQEKVEKLQEKVYKQGSRIYQLEQEKKKEEQIEVVESQSLDHFFFSPKRHSSQAGQPTNVNPKSRSFDQ